MFDSIVQREACVTDNMSSARMTTPFGTAVVQVAIDTTKPSRNQDCCSSTETQDHGTSCRHSDTKGSEDALSKQSVVMWRGMSYMQLSQKLSAEGGTEFAPMSTTTDTLLQPLHARLVAQQRTTVLPSATRSRKTLAQPWSSVL